MICPHCEIGSYFGTCTCKVAHTHCPFMRRCSIEHCWLPLDSMDACTRRNKEKEVGILMANEYKVEFESKGKLYININGQVKRIPNPFDYSPKKVELININNEWYIKGYEPKSIVEPVAEDGLRLKKEIGEKKEIINKEKSNKKKKVSKRASTKKEK